MGLSITGLLCCLATLSGCAAEVTPLVVGHRGLPGQHPDNSVVGLLAAAAAGADAVELDVQLGPSGALLMAHDADPDCQERTPEALSAFLDAEGGRYSKLFIELKGTQSNRAALASAAVKLVQARGLGRRAVITSFDPDAIAAAMLAVQETQERPEFALQLLTDGGLDVSSGCTPMSANGSEAQAAELDVEWVLWPALSLDAADVRLALAGGRKVGTWSSGENPAHIWRALDLGVHAIYTDVPGLLRGVVDAR